MKEENKVPAEVIAHNRKALNVIGSTMGAQYFKAETRSAWPGFEEELIAAKNDPLSIMINHEPKRYRITGHDIVSIVTKKDTVGAPMIYLNEGLSGEVAIPFGVNIDGLGAVVEDALSKALHGDKNIIFNDGEKLCGTVNQLNYAGLNRVRGLIEKLQKVEDSYRQTIAENEKKVKDYIGELIKSKENVATMPKNGGVVITVSSETTEE